MTAAPVGAERYLLEAGSLLLSGVQALTRLVVEQRHADVAAGLDTGLLVTGYPGSPLGGYDLELGRQADLLTSLGVVHRMGLNEELAATAIQGSQLAHTLPGARHEGVVGIWYGKAPGLDRAADAIRHGNVGGAGRAGGVLLVVGDDPAAASSTVPSACESTLAAMQVPVLHPGDVSELLHLGLHGIAMSRCTGTWVGFKVTSTTAEGHGDVTVGPGLVAPVPVTPMLDGRPHAHEPGRVYLGDALRRLEHSLNAARLPATVEYARANGLNRIVERGSRDRIGLVAAGKSYFQLRQALTDLGVADRLGQLGIRVLHLRLVHPLDHRLVQEFADDLSEVVVVEDKQPFLERLVKEALYHRAERPTVVGKTDEHGGPLASPDGALSTDDIARLVGGRLLARWPELEPVRARLDELDLARRRVALPLLTRTPYFCSGCPHNSSLQAPDGALVAAGIGCHGMVHYLGPEDGVGQVTGMTQMGGEGAQWIGQAPFTDDPHVFQNLGDGTFLHSGSLAVRAAVAAGVTMTYKLLWNSHVAMTGGQEAVGAARLPEVVRGLLAEGVTRVVVTSDEPRRWRRRDFPRGVRVWHRDRLVEAQEMLAGVPGVTVLVHDQECAAELRRGRTRGTVAAPARSVVVNERVCEGCGDCGVASHCLSLHPVDTEFGRKTRVHQASCNADEACLAGDCPSFLLVTPTKGGARARPGVGVLDPSDLPAPPDLFGDLPEFRMRLSGIGGTGIVTVAQILAHAAADSGRRVRGTDQTGLAQKGGPVVSDLRLGRAEREGAASLPAGSCHLHLACDAVVAATPQMLEAQAPGTTVAVVSTSAVPTGAMVSDPRTAPLDTAVVTAALLARATPASRAVDAQALSERLIGTSGVANVFLLGVAHQVGAVPLPGEAIERAIARNGVAVDRNVQAFRRGRQLVADPAGLEAALKAAQVPASTSGRVGAPPAEAVVARLVDLVGAEPTSRLEDLVTVRVRELIGYQSPRYAERYARGVARARAAEADQVPGTTAYAEAVAVGLHKLMAYKDEYEVARLHLDPATRRRIEEEWGVGARVRYQLHPPLLRTLGMRRKISVGRWFDAIFRLLVAMRRLRGTPVDPFGATALRRLERRLVTEYEETLDLATSSLSPVTHADAVALAELPDLVRGYEEVKLRSVAEYEQRRAELLSRLTALSPRPA